MNGEKPFFDTNILIYATASGDSRGDIARSLLLGGGTISVQILNEFASVALRKLKMSWTDLLATLDDFYKLFPSPAPITIATHNRALIIAREHGLNIYDALVIAAAFAAGCDVLYSEDMQDGQLINGITIRNPFRSAVQASTQF